jgi:hypothetical protein
MGVGVIDGEAQRKCVDKVKAERHGYNPHRRSLMHVIGENLVKLNQEGRYRSLYLEEKARQAEMHPEMTPMHCHRRAMRKMEKALLADLWKVWGTIYGLLPTGGVSPDLSAVGREVTV